MFEPENDLERSLMRAGADPQHRGEFLGALLNAEIFLALIPSGGQVVPGPDGKATVTPGTRLELSPYVRGDQKFLPFFTCPMRARALFPQEHLIAPDKARDLFERHRNTPFALNPGSDYGLELLWADIERLLQGDASDGLRSITLAPETEVAVGQPAEYPADVVAALSAIFQDIPSVDAAYLGEVILPGQDPHLHVAINSSGDWNALLKLMGPRLQSTLPPGRVIDFAPLAGSVLESYFRSSTEPFFVRPTGN